MFEGYLDSDTVIVGEDIIITFAVGRKVVGKIWRRQEAHFAIGDVQTRVATVCPEIDAVGELEASVAGVG